jgi:hypothetical protein
MKVQTMTSKMKQLQKDLANVNKAKAKTKPSLTIVRQPTNSSNQIKSDELKSSNKNSDSDEDNNNESN